MFRSDLRAENISNCIFIKLSQKFTFKPSYQFLQTGKSAHQLYCATKTNLFSIDDKGEITRFSKANGLNDIGVNAIGWDETSKQLIIAYQNSNIDILKGSIVRNISDVLQSKVAGNKTINHIYCKNGIAYLSTGLGIILVDLNRYEIKDSWIIGSNGSLSNINATITDVMDASNNNPSPIFSCSAVVDFLKPENSSQKIHNIISTMGKCNNNGCMRPMVCTNGGIDKRLSNISKKTSRQFNAKPALYKIAFHRCIDYYSLFIN